MFQVKSFKGFKDLAAVVLLRSSLLRRQAPSMKAPIDWGLGAWISEVDRQLSILAGLEGFQNVCLLKYLVKPALSDLMVVIEDSSDGGLF